MIYIINTTDEITWDDAVKKIPMADVYYMHEYMEAFRLHGDGESVLIEYVGDSCRGICAMMKRDVADDANFKNLIPSGKYFDIITPYGYGGFVFDRRPSAEDSERLRSELWEVLANEGAVAAFFRFHPVLANASCSRNILDVTDLGHTIALDLTSPEIIWENITSKNRNMIRKAEKSGIKIKHGKGMALLDVFIDIYNETMRHDKADEYYFFKREFYESIDRDLHENYEIFYAEYEDEIVAMSIILFSRTQMHYHLSGSRYEYRRFAPSNLLLYKAALWGCEQGFKTFHLGGGIGSVEDNLYKFKAAFNRNSDYQFSIGRKVIDNEKYQFLTNIRENNDSEFNKESSFFPVYRS